ncbi:MAG TPA: hypothetical protein VGB53_17220 [Rubricoccaceae bacterium]
MYHTSTLRALAVALPLAFTMSACDSNDEDISSEASVYAVSNPTGTADTAVRLSQDLTSTEATFSGFTGVTNVQNVFVTSDGDGYFTVDTGSAITASGGIVYVANLCDEDADDSDGDGDDGCSNTNATIGAGSRMITGAATGLVAPKGIINEGGRLIVADNGSNSIRVFPETASGDVAPTFVVTNLGAAGRNVWDIAFDDGRLYVAATDGTVLVYDNFLSNQGATGPTRIITPTAVAGGAQISTNLHGIAFDGDTGYLVLTDVGGTLPTSGSDGQIFVIANGETASGNTPVRYQISGSQLGNPVDLDLSEDGVLYVAEKANNAVLRFNNVLTATGTSTAPAAASIAVASAESVSIANE